MKRALASTIPSQEVENILANSALIYYWRNRPQHHLFNGSNYRKLLHNEWKTVLAQILPNSLR